MSDNRLKVTSREQFLRKLKTKCDEMGSQAALARALKVSPQYLSSVLLGERPPGPKLTAALGFKVEKTYITLSA